jgi:ABC-type sugar transport system substrate-binding protein
MENALQAHPDIGAVFSATDGLLPPVRAALEKVGRFKPVGEPDHVIILSVDGDPQGCAAVKEGWMDAGYAQPVPLMSRRTIEVIIDIAKNGKKPEGDDRIQLIPGTEYMKSNIEQTEGEVWGC